MPCEILTEGVLESALRHRLSAEERAVLLGHLREPCEACLDVLEGRTVEEMLAPHELSPEEEERLFAAAVPARLRPQLKPAHLERRRPPRFAWVATAAAVAAAVWLVMVQAPSQGRPPEGLKGAPASAAALIPLVGGRSPMPHVIRALAPGGRLAPGEVLLLRIRLDAPAWVYLLSQKQGEAAELIWPLQAPAQHEPGEFEVAESGSALAFDPAALAGGGRLLLIASPSPLDAGRLQIGDALRTREELEKAFPGCAIDVLPILSGAP